MKVLYVGAALLISISTHGAGSPTIDLSRDAQERIGLTTEVLQPKIELVTVAAYARAIDAGPLASLDAEIASARAAAESSGSEATRVSALVKSDLAASVRAQETADMQARSDQARLTLAERRVSLEWTPVLRDAAIRTSLLNEISRGTSTLVRVDVPAWTGGVPNTIGVIPDRDAPPITARLLGRAMAADPLLQAPAFFAVVEGQDASLLPVGTQTRAWLATGATEPGFVLPRSALLRWRGAVWVYVKSAEESFERRVVSNARISNDGWFVSSGFGSGDVVVTSGVMTLHTLELGGTALADE